MGTVSVIIAARNEEENILDLLKSLLKYDLDKKCEIIIVDSGTDDTDKICSQYPSIKYFKMPKRLFPGEARNIGIKNANGNILAFLDADTIIQQGWYEELLKSAEKHDIIAGSSPSLPGQQERLPRVSIFIDGQDITWPTCNLAYKKEGIDKAGIFREGMPSGGDIELNYRCVKAGFKIYYNEKMRVYHKLRSTVKGFIKQSYRDGYVRAQLEALIPEIRGKHQFGKLTGRNLLRLGFGALGYARKRWFSRKVLDR